MRRSKSTDSNKSDGKSDVANYVKKTFSEELQEQLNKESNRRYYIDEQHRMERERLDAQRRMDRERRRMDEERIRAQEALERDRLNFQRRIDIETERIKRDLEQARIRNEQRRLDEDIRRKREEARRTGRHIIQSLDLTPPKDIRDVFSTGVYSLTPTEPQDLSLFQDTAVKIKDLLTVLKATFEDTLIITEYDESGIVSITWKPDQGAYEYGHYNHNEEAKTTVFTKTNTPCSFPSWEKVFRVLKYFFDKNFDALYLARTTDWDGSMNDIFRLDATIRVHFDQIEQKWQSTVDNVTRLGPFLFTSLHDDVLYAITDALTQSILYEKWLRERLDADPSYRDITDSALAVFNDWKNLKRGIYAD